jgi:hypothetical protein
MSFLGYAPSASPMVPEQIKGIGDQLYRRIDGSNTPFEIFKNGFINSAFDFNQRSRTYSVTGAGGAYTFDRWYISNGPNGNTSLTPVGFSFGEAPTESRYFARVAATGQTGANDVSLLTQYIEGVRRFAGKRVVIRGLARRSAGSGSVAIELSQYFGAGGTAQVNKYAGSFTPTTVFTPFAVIVDVPAVTGSQVLGSSNNDSLLVNFWLSGGSSFNARTNNLGLQTLTVDFADLEIKEVMPGFGDQFPGYERIPRDIEYLRCLRYFEYAVGLIQTSAGNGSLTHTHPFKVIKRAVPSVAVTSTSNGAGSTGLISQGIWEGAVGLQMNITAAGAYTYYTFTADAEI